MSNRNTLVGYSQFALGTQGRKCSGGRVVLSFIDRGAPVISMTYGRATVLAAKWDHWAVVVVVVEAFSVGTIEGAFSAWMMTVRAEVAVRPAASVAT